MDVLSKIKKLQKENELNNAELARKAGIPPTTLQAMYKRNNQPTISTLQALCRAFGITVSQFFADSNIPLDLTPEQANLLEHWNTLTDEQKEAVLSLIKSM